MIFNDLKIKEWDSADGNEMSEMFTAAYKHTKNCTVVYKIEIKEM